METNNENNTLHNDIKEKKKGYNLPRPNLLKRVFGALIDFVLAFILFMVLEAAEYYTVFNAIGYTAKINEIHELYSDSHLYIYDSASRTFSELKDNYDDKKSPKDNYDDALIYYFSNDSRCVNDKKLEDYKTAKINSGLFKENTDGTISESSTDTTKLRLFYENTYISAVAYFRSNPTYISDLNFTYNTIIVSILINGVISLSIFYLVIPLLRKDGETLGYMVFKMGVADARNDTRVKKGQIVVRFLVFMSFNFLVSLGIYTRWSYFTLVPIFITCIMVIATKSNSGLHEYISHTYVVDKKDITIKTNEEKIKEEASKVRVFNPLHKEGDE
jgi:uncharacterized RDD family membrane protein YckC